MKYYFTEKNPVISSSFLVWKFCGKAHFLHRFGWIVRNYAEAVHFHKIPTLVNLAKLRDFSQYLFVGEGKKRFENLKKCYSKKKNNLKRKSASGADLADVGRHGLNNIFSYVNQIQISEVLDLTTLSQAATTIQALATQNH